MHVRKTMCEYTDILVYFSKNQIKPWNVEEIECRDTRRYYNIMISQVGDATCISRRHQKNRIIGAYAIRSIPIRPTRSR